MCATCTPRVESCRAAVVWRDPNYPPPEPAHWERVIVSGETPAAAVETAVEWRRLMVPTDMPAVVLYLGSGFTSQFS